MPATAFLLNTFDFYQDSNTSWLEFSKYYQETQLYLTNGRNGKHAIGEKWEIHPCCVAE